MENENPTTLGNSHALRTQAYRLVATLAACWESAERRRILYLEKRTSAPDPGPKTAARQKRNPKMSMSGIRPIDQQAGPRREQGKIGKLHLYLCHRDGQRRPMPQPHL